MRTSKGIFSSHKPEKDHNLAKSDAECAMHQGKMHRGRDYYSSEERMGRGGREPMGRKRKT